MKNFKAVVFDMDGVIFDSERMVLECWNQVAERHNIEDVESICKRCMGLTREATRVIFKQRYGEDFPYDEYKQETREIFFSKDLPVKVGTRELLEKLKQSGKLIALASSTRSNLVKKELSDAGLIDYFNQIVCGDMVEKSKPDPEIFLKACALLNVNPGEAYGIEDSYNGIRSVHAANMRAIMVPDMLPADDEMRNLSEAVLESLVQVKAYLFE